MGPGPAIQEGELVTYVADYEDGHSERWHALRRDDGREIQLLPQAPLTVTAGARIRVSGYLTAERFAVDDLRLIVGPQQVESALVTYAAPSQDTYALVLVDVGSGVDLTVDAGQTAMFSTTPADKSFASFYFESSYGKYSISGDVVGPYSYPMTGCNTTGMQQAIEPQITKSYNHLIYYFKRTNGCSFAGLGEEGSVTRPAKRTWMNGSLGCVVLMQEPGHNIGLMHANTMKCGTASFSDTPSTACTITEYGSTLTPMGSGCHQLNGYEKWYSQWLSGCNGVRVASGGSFNLVPLGLSCPGAVQVLQIPMPATRVVSDPQAAGTAVNLKDYYVELRAPAGVFDQYSTGHGPGGGAAFTQPVVSIYASDDVHTGNPMGHGGPGNSVWTELLNMTPGSASFAGLTTKGQTFSDPTGSPTITLVSISATGAVVTVTTSGAAPGGAAPTCMDGTTLVGAGSLCEGGAVGIPPPDAGPAPTGLGMVDAAGGPAPDAASLADATDSRRPAREAGGARTDVDSGMGTMTGGAGSLIGRRADGGAMVPPSGNPSTIEVDGSDATAIAGWEAESHGCSCRAAGETAGGLRGGSAMCALAALGTLRRRRLPRATLKSTLPAPGSTRASSKGASAGAIPGR